MFGWSLSQLSVVRFMSYFEGSYKPITNTAWVRARICNLEKGCTRLVAASEKSLPVACLWSSSGVAYIEATEAVTSVKKK